MLKFNLTCEKIRIVADAWDGELARSAPVLLFWQELNLGHSPFTRKGEMGCEALSSLRNLKAIGWPEAHRTTVGFASGRDEAISTPNWCTEELREAPGTLNFIPERPEKLPQGRLGAPKGLDDPKREPRAGSPRIHSEGGGPEVSVGNPAREPPKGPEDFEREPRAGPQRIHSQGGARIYPLGIPPPPPQGFTKEPQDPHKGRKQI